MARKLMTPLVALKVKARDRRRAWYAGGFCGVLFLLSLFTALIQVGYAPYEFRGYTSVPPETCPGEAIQLTVLRKIDKRYSVERVEATSAEWYPAGESAGRVPVFVSPSAVPLGVKGSSYTEARISADTPREAGYWTFRSEVRITGSVLGMRAVQDVVAESKSILLVLPESDKRCSGEDA